MKNKLFLLLCLAALIQSFTSCERKSDYAIEIINVHELIPGQSWNLYLIGHGRRINNETDRNIKWEVEDKNILTIDSCGIVTAHKEGETRVYAYYAPLKSADTVTIKVGKFLDFSRSYEDRALSTDDNNRIYNYLLETGVDKDNDMKISADEIHSVEVLDLISYFCDLGEPFVTFRYLDVCTNLRDFSVKSASSKMNGVGTSKIDFSKNKMLEYVSISGCELEIYFSSDNTNLIAIELFTEDYMQDNVAYLDLSKSSKLRFLQIHCKIGHIDLSGCSNLEFLSYNEYSHTPFTFDCSKSPKLKYFLGGAPYYNLKYVTIKLEPSLFQYYSEGPKRKRRDEVYNENDYTWLSKTYGQTYVRDYSCYFDIENVTFIQ